MERKPEHKYNLLEHFLFFPTRINRGKLSKKIKGKTLLITGATFGIGESVTRLLASCGARLILVGRTLEKLEALQKELNQKGADIHIYAADLKEESDRLALIDYLLAQDRLDVVINNAGKSIRRPFLKSLDRNHDFTRTMAINYEGPVQLLLPLVKKLEASGGHIVNVSTIAVLLAPTPFWAAYQASKSAFDQWFRCAQPELESIGISTSSIYLPLVKTRMIAPTKHYNNFPAMQPEHVARIIGKCILKEKRVYKPGGVCLDS